MAKPNPIAYMNDAGNAIIKIDNTTSVDYNNKRNSVSFFPPHLSWHQGLVPMLHYSLAHPTGPDRDARLLPRRLALRLRRRAPPLRVRRLARVLDQRPELAAGRRDRHHGAGQPRAREPDDPPHLRGVHAGERRAAARQDGRDGLLRGPGRGDGVQRRGGAAEQLRGRVRGERGRGVGDAVRRDGRVVSALCPFFARSPWVAICLRMGALELTLMANDRFAFFCAASGSGR